MRPFLRRAAGIEALKRTTNERAVSEDAAVGVAVRIVCECSDLECDTTLDVAPVLLRSVREHPARFLVARSHVTHEIERVVDDRGAFVVVEKASGFALAVRETSDRLAAIATRLRRR